MNIVPVMITCPGREAMLAQTLASWDETDFNRRHDVRPLLQLDTNQHERRQERQEHNSLAALHQALQVAKLSSAAEFILFLEDDLLFNRHLYHNLMQWAPLRRHLARQQKIHTVQESMFFASLYDCTIRELERHAAEHYFIADPDAVYGSQAFLLSVPLARYCADHWWEVPGMQDMKMSRLAARLCPTYYHTPSLVQHVGVKSVWGGHFHDTRDFDGEFEA